MTETEWLECGNPHLMLDYLKGKVSDRKLRLFACACVRLVWDLLDDSRDRSAVEVAERFADGLATVEERDAAAAWYAYWAAALAAALAAARSAARGATCAVLQGTVLRSMVHNPFRPLPALPAGRQLHDLARAAYEQRLADGRLDPVRLAVLADALEDAQAPEQIMQNLRSPGPHHRGCWAVDLILGKK